jgi:hypothetical protein
VENTKFLRLRLLLLAASIIIGISASAVVAVAADGTVLRSFDAPVILKTSADKVDYWPVGIAFDGKNLYYSQPAGVTDDIFKTTTSGALIQTLSVVEHAGALAWDGSHLWVASYTDASSVGNFLYELSVTGTPTVLKTVDITQIYRTHGACGFTDGLGYDPATGTLWVSPDPCNTGCSAGLGLVFNVDTNGNLLQSLQFPFGVSGVAIAGKGLYIVNRCAPNQHVVSIDQITTKGKMLSSFNITQVDPHNWAESIDLDGSTFSPNCALWTMQPYPSTTGFSTLPADIVAYQIACP